MHDLDLFIGMWDPEKDLAKLPKRGPLYLYGQYICILREPGGDHFDLPRLIVAPSNDNISAVRLFIRKRLFYNTYNITVKADNWRNEILMESLSLSYQEELNQFDNVLYQASR